MNGSAPCSEEAATAEETRGGGEGATEVEEPEGKTRSCNPCIRHHGKQEGARLDAYDLASPCCDPRCVTASSAKRRSRKHRQNSEETPPPPLPAKPPKPAKPPSRHDSKGECSELEYCIFLRFERVKKLFSSCCFQIILTSINKCQQNQQINYFNYI